MAGYIKWLFGNYEGCDGVYVVKNDIWQSYVTYTKQHAKFKARYSDFTIVVQALFPLVSVAYQKQADTRVRVYRHLRAKNSPHPDVKPEPLCWQSLQSIQNSMVLYGWSPTPCLERSQNVSWLLTSSHVCDGHVVIKKLEVDATMAWHLYVNDNAVMGFNLSLAQYVTTVTELETILYICAHIPLCQGFPVNNKVESKDGGGNIIGQTYQWGSAVKEEAVTFRHKSGNCALIVKFNSKTMTCANCADLKKRFSSDQQVSAEKCSSQELGDNLEEHSNRTDGDQKQLHPVVNLEVNNEEVLVEDTTQNARQVGLETATTVVLFKKYKCSQCTYSTNRKNHLRSHMPVHATDKPFCCIQCPYRSARPEALANHSKTHSEKRPLHCDYCSFTTKHYNSIKMHVKLHDTRKPYCCSSCTFRTKHKASLQSHLLTHSAEKPLKCQQCDFSTKHQVSLKLHRRMHEGSRPYKCAQCSFEASSQSNLKQHSRVHSNEKPYMCLDCGALFKSSNSLKHHKMSHLGVKPYVCNVCGKAFGQRENLKRHQVVHTREKRAYCQQCKVAFSLEENFKRHLKRIHNNPGQRFYCDVCGKGISSRGNLQRHIDTVHNQAKKYQCAICKKSYTSNVNLKRHETSHSLHQADQNLHITNLSADDSGIEVSADLYDPVDVGLSKGSPGTEKTRRVRRQESNSTPSSTLQESNLPVDDSDVLGEQHPRLLNQTSKTTESISHDISPSQFIIVKNIKSEPPDMLQADSRIKQEFTYLNVKDEPEPNPHD